MNEYSEREKAQIEHAREYLRKFSDAGAPGHSQFLLIAKLWQDREELRERLAHNGGLLRFLEK